MDELARLAAAAGDGEPERLETLLRESSGLVHAVVRARLGDTLAADEAAAEALARAARWLPGLRDPQAFAAWITRIAARCATDAARRNGAAVVATRDEAPDPSPGPAEEAVAAERARTIRDAVKKLPVRLRDPLLLHFTEGFSYREVARALGVGLGTVARRMEKALAALARALGDEP